MKPFDLEAAKRGEPIQTRDGTPVKFIAHVPEAIKLSRVLVLLDDYIWHGCENGKLYSYKDHETDLFMAPRKRTVWVNLYDKITATHFCTKELADYEHRYTCFDRIGHRAWPLEIEE